MPDLNRKYSTHSFIPLKINKLKVLGAYWKIFIAGFTISFIGALPLGSLNATAFQIAAEQNIKSALIFALVATVVELIIVAFLTSFVNVRVASIKPTLRKYLGLAACFLLCTLVVYNFNNAFETVIQNFNPTISASSAFALGIVLSATNPFQIPFWIGWNLHLKEKRLLTKEKFNVLSYISGIGLATLCVMTLFILAGKELTQHVTDYKKFISYLMGTVYFLLAAYIFLKIFFIRIFPIHLSKRYV